MDLEVKPFYKKDFPEYLNWFQDVELNQQLGPMEEEDEWLISVLNDNAGCTYSVFMNKTLVAVVGIAYPDQEHPAYYITNIAVKPSLRSSGIGKGVLEKVTALYELGERQYWIAYVDESNPKAKSFFEKLGWECVTNLPINGMFLLEYGK